jgi:ribonucleoside-diphosphate reductase alpha chain
MKIDRRYTKEGESPYSGIHFEKRTSEIKTPDDEVIFRQEGVFVPSFWSQTATDILAQKYFRKTGVPLGDGKTGGENDLRQVCHRLAHTWMEWGKKGGYFSSEKDAWSFYDETCYMLANQIGAPNSPQWFNTGLYSVYGIKGPAQGHYYFDDQSGRVEKTDSTYERPQPHACFILGVEDNLVNEDGIMDLITKEARLFKYGSGSGANYSKIRGENEPLSGGGVSSGLLSFLKVGDRSASAIKSGGTTRRAARMIVLDADHPDSEKFIKWKVKEENKVLSMVTGSKIIKKHIRAIAKSCDDAKSLEYTFDPKYNRQLRKAIEMALKDEVPPAFIYRIIQLKKQFLSEPDFDEYSTDWEGEAYNTVSGQASNNSIRLNNEFMEGITKKDRTIILRDRSGKKNKEVPIKELFNAIALATWQSADPGVQFHDAINEWNTCPEDGEIRASNPCSEYMFLDDTACNLASLNLLKFYSAETGEFDTESFRHAIHIWTIVLEISVYMAQYPSKSIARRSYEYRTLGLGFANLGALLMVMGYPYDSDRGREIASAISSILTGQAYVTSSKIAAELGPFSKYKKNESHMLRVIHRHKFCTESLCLVPKLKRVAEDTWEEAMLGASYGYRNAQVTVIAPTGTIGLLMDCDTTGIEPDYSVVKFKKLAGGGTLKIINRSIPLALKTLGYSEEQINDIIRYCIGMRSLWEISGKMSISGLEEKGFSMEILDKIDKALEKGMSFDYVFSPSFLGEVFLCSSFNLSPEEINTPGFSILKHLSCTDEEIELEDRMICGTGTLENAPHLKKEHYAVFDTASKSGRFGTRHISWKAHIDMVAAVQPFISGGISKTINMPNSATVEDIKRAYIYSWEKMLKSIAIYRDGSKLSQPLNALAPGTDPAADAILNMMKEEEPKEQSVEIHYGPGPIIDSPKDLASHIKNKQVKKRNPLPTRRLGYTQKAKIGGHSLFLRTGNYNDGSLGEIFLDMHKEGAAFRSLLNSFAIAVSLGLQYGVSLEEYVDAFTFSKFAPNGMVVGHDQIKMATSVLDFIFRDLALSYLERTDLGQIKPDDLNDTSIKPNGNEQSRNDTYQVARIQGYEGDPCPACEHFTLVRNGTCLKCETCGSTTGCS